MSRAIRWISLTALVLGAVEGAPLANRNFAPDWTFTGSSMGELEPIGSATWAAQNGEIVGRPTTSDGGWLLLKPALQDVQIATVFQCAAGCQAGFLLRAEKTAEGYRGVFVSISDSPGAFAVTLDAQGRFKTKEPIPAGGGTVRFLSQNAGARGGGRGPAPAAQGAPAPAPQGATPPAPAAPAGTATPGAPPAAGPAGQARAGGPGRGGRGFAFPEGAPYVRPSYTLQPGEWNSIESILDANILRTWLNDGPESGVASGRVDDVTARYGRVGLYVGGTTEVRYRTVELKDLGKRVFTAEKVGPRFRLQQLNDFYYAWSATAADVNRDGHLDVLAGPHYFLGPDFETSREIYLGNILNPGADYAPGAGNFAFDWTRDGWPDVIVTEGRNFVMYVNPGSEQRRWERHPAFSNSCEVVAFADINADRVPDVVILNGGMVSYATINPTDPTAPWIVQNVSGPGYTVVAQHGIGAGDINGDSRVDILNPYGWWEQPAVSSTPGPWKYHPVAFGRWPRAGASPGGAELRVFDVNGDGTNDVVTSLEAHGWGLAWFEQKRNPAGESSWTQHLIMDGFDRKNPGGVTFSQLHALTSADVDGDGIQDIITGRRMFAHLDSFNDPDPRGDAVLYVFRTVRNPRAPGGAEFVPELVHNRSGVGSQLQTADLNKDGAADILTATDRGTFIFWGTKGRR
jgi:hypothetical protein